MTMTEMSTYRQESRYGVSAARHPRQTGTQRRRVQCSPDCGRERTRSAQQQPYRQPSTSTPPQASQMIHPSQISHVSFMRMWDCRTFRILQQNARIAFFPHRLAFSTAILTSFVSPLPISIRFRYLDLLVANRMAPSTCPDPCGTRWDSRFQAISYHISAHIFK